MEMMTLFKTALLVMLFYSFSITLITYALPAETLDHTTIFSDLNSDMSLENVGSEVQETLDRQLDIPVIEVGALVFYSGNILIDFILNFAFAFPEMIGLLMAGVTHIFVLDSYIVAITELFAATLFFVAYIIGAIQLILSIRSGQVV